jgi:Zn-dependent peptidase ImmA (M78 family)
MAHELGHLVMHRFSFTDRDGESEANRFAAELLMPADQIRPRLKNITLRRAADLKLEWRISINAVIQRAKGLNTITNQEAIRLHKQRSARRWTKVEPLSDQLLDEQPATLARVLDTLQSAGYSRNELAELLYLPDISDHPTLGGQLRLVR